MDKLEFKGTWNKVKGRLKKSCGSLTDDDLTYAEGQEDQMLGKLQKNLAKHAMKLSK